MLIKAYWFYLRFCLCNWIFLFNFSVHKICFRKEVKPYKGLEQTHHISQKLNVVHFRISWTELTSSHSFKIPCEILQVNESWCTAYKCIWRVYSYRSICTLFKLWEEVMVQVRYQKIRILFCNKNWTYYAKTIDVKRVIL